MIATERPRAIWEDPDNPGTTFIMDPMHFPGPMSKLWQATAQEALTTGFTEGFRHYNAPMDHYQCTYRNNYHFETYVPKSAASEDEAKAMGALAEKTFSEALPGMRQRWEETHLPAILELHETLRSIAALSPEEAATVENIQTVRSELVEIWRHHFKIVLPMFLALQLFDELHHELFGPDSDPDKLLIGVESESVKSGYAMSDLAKRAKSLGLSSIMLETPVEDLPAKLQETEAGRAFAAELATSLEYYGLRQDVMDFPGVTWIEDPTIPLLQIRHYLATGRDNRSETAELQAEVAEATKDARNALSAYPEQVRAQWEALLEYSLDATFLHEEHNFYLDQQANALARLALLNIGSGLTKRNVIDKPEDVFMLSFDQLTDAAQNPSVDYKSIAREAWQDLDRSRALSPPPFIGPPPADPDLSNPLMRGIMRFFGGPPQESGDPNVIKGNAGSRGQVEGTAFVARTLSEASTLEPGQILVAVTTTPPWTPLFGVAAAVVTETGGPLSHCAVVAREYLIPAVVGAHGATSRIKTGQRIAVDGTNGVVTLLD